MQTYRPFVLSIAGFDPSAGAGVLADVKTFEQNHVYGLAILTANTIQTEDKFISLQWIAIESVLESIETLFTSYDIKSVKIGIIPSLDYLKKIIFRIKEISPETAIIWDTIINSTSNFNFFDVRSIKELLPILSKIDLITPNFNEVVLIGDKKDSINKTVDKLTKYCSVLLKGGHNPQEKGTDYLYTKDRFFKIPAINNEVAAKHGSGCVLSAAIAANLALGSNLLTACKLSKIYAENFLLSNPSQLGYHDI
ncbi:hydroxymethylpyrimidine/phosphomethylpyrimidine kinase [Flavobacterium algicola]|uniref:hydroxymethylpyrimidine/phosphomethylpyrimidine kinase n=1 Tax=Flavobacterium algicola TaxID=556529 RepID=UPI001EFDBCA3|nr:hydroxymethylpyrimidine/phosphomethylpyrimidine kinase [Flavobacterium algicola]MCG9791569.1 hydroxymethylpyrimidine/phosphomethylpyrimidine kinase [Flavobacterium algicola]